MYIYYLSYLYIHYTITQIDTLEKLLQKAKEKLQSCKAEREILVQDLKSVQVELIFFFLHLVFIYIHIYSNFMT